MKNAGRLTTLVLALGLVAAAAAPAANAQARTIRGEATSATQGDGLVVAKSVSQGTLTVDDQTFRVEPRTRVLDLDGKPISLAKVPLRTDPPFSMNQTQPGAVRYRAVQGRNGWTLVEVQLVEAEPR